MLAHAEREPGRTSLVLNLQLTRGRHGAAARIELHERPTGRIAVLALRGWLDVAAEHGLERALDDLAARGAARLLVDCSQLRHVDYRMVPRFLAALAAFESRAGAFVLCGLSRYLRDVFRTAGCESRVREWPAVHDLLDPPLAEARRERAS